jgi:hypothetical protein
VEMKIEEVPVVEESNRAMASAPWGMAAISCHFGGRVLFTCAKARKAIRALSDNLCHCG